MTGDDTEAITESAKAVQEVAKVGGKAIDATREAGGWLDRIFGQGIEDSVALHWSDRVRARRIEAAIYDWERLTELMRKIDARLQAKGVNTLRLVPPKIALALIENATVEEEDDLHTLWANLFATGLDASAEEIHRKYVSTLADMTGADALVFKLIHDAWHDPNNKYKSKFTEGALTYGPSVDGTASHDALSVITLNRLGLISPAYIEIQVHDPPRGRDYEWGHRADAMQAYGDLTVVEVTAFGTAFYKAVMSD
jgi:hypothetical protein